VLQALDAGAMRRWAAASVSALDAHRDAIDRINVYPVADHDTGSNLLHTMRAGLSTLLYLPTESTAGSVITAFAKGALAEARGNSGVIISQLFRGLGEALADTVTVTGPAMADALTRGAELARAAVSNPMPGTMLTVLTAAAQAAREAAGSASHAEAQGAREAGSAGDSAEDGREAGLFGNTAGSRAREAGPVSDPAAAQGAREAGSAGDAVAAQAARDAGSGSLVEVVRTAVGAAAEALERTPRQLAVLASAGVVDAGGRGVVVLLDALLAIVSGESAALAAARSAVAAPENPLVTRREAGSEQYAYEVMYLLEGNTNSAAVLRDALVGLGDCVSVVGDGDGVWAVHVHCNDVGAAVEAGVEAGRPRKIRVARFDDMPATEISRFTKDRAVVAPVRSEEFAALLTAEGVAALRVIEPSVYDLLDVITGTGAAHVAVLPADRGLIEIADEAAIRAVAAGQDVVVVPCSAPVQVLAAVAVHDPRRRAGDDVVRMAEAAALTRRGEVAIAAEDAMTWVGRCQAGDILGFADGEVVLIEPGPASMDSLDRVARGVLTRMLSMGGELVTVLLGADAPPELEPELQDFLHLEHPEADLAVYHGGQLDAVLHIGVE
jgi:fatty acid kinase